MLFHNPEYDSDQAFSFYPSAGEIDDWCAALLADSAKTEVTGTFLNTIPFQQSFGNGPNSLQNQFVRFTTSGQHVFYGYWQPAMKQPAPLLINLPGYGAYMSFHPQINDDGYNILHISPLGYVTPDSIDQSRLMEDGNWPVLPNTALGLPSNYRDWLLDALLAIRWAEAQPSVLPERMSLFGTSQGGGGSLLLASLLQGKVRCVCADLAFLTAFPLTGLEGIAYGLLKPAYQPGNEAAFWRNLGFVDTVSHAHRIHVPVMLSAGGKDNVCPPDAVRLLFERLNTTKQFTYLEDGVHTHSRQSMYLIRSWLAMFA